MGASRARHDVPKPTDATWEAVGAVHAQVLAWLADGTPPEQAAPLLGFVADTIPVGAAAMWVSAGCGHMTPSHPANGRMS